MLRTFSRIMSMLAMIAMVAFQFSENYEKATFYVVLAVLLRVFIVEEDVSALKTK